MARKSDKSYHSILKKDDLLIIDPEAIRPQRTIPFKLNTLIALGVFVFTLIIYMLTNAKSLSFWDSGEYITCSSILGIPHAPGNPFYIILGRFFCIMGGGIPHAMIVSFISSLLSALGVMFTYLMTVQLLTMVEKNKYLIISGGIIAAFLTAFSFTYWQNAIEAEVYGGLAFIINLIIWLTFVWVKKQKDFSHQTLLLLIVYIFFLGFCIHQTSLQIAPAILYIIFYPLIMKHIKTSSFWMKCGFYTLGLLIVYVIFNKIGQATNIPVLEKFVLGIAFFGILYYYLRDKISKRVWLLALGLIIIGFSPHIFLYIRSSIRPYINEGYPHNFNLFMDYILRRQYGDFSFLERRASLFSEQIGYHFLRYFSWQFMHVETVAQWFKAPVMLIQMISNLLVAFLGLMGFYFTFKKNKHTFRYIVSIFFMVSIAMIFVMNLSDKEVRDRDYFFVTAYNFWAVIMGIGVIGLIRSLDFLKARKAIQAFLLIILLSYPMVNMGSQYFIHDRTGELISLDYGLNIINSIEENAIIFTNGDNDTFPLWYAQAVKDPNSVEYVHPAKDVYPTENTKAIIKDAIEYKNQQGFGVRKDVTIANLSLLNTPWYIRQLRDKEGVEFSMDDKQIDQLRPFKLPTDSEVEINSPNNADNFTISLKEGLVLYVSNIAVIQIIKDNYGKRPIYFAVTCSETSGFDQHLRNEGMVDRLVPIEGKEQLDLDRTIKNLNEVYKYRGIFNDKLYKDENMVRLITNYGAAYMRLSEYYKKQKDFKSAETYFNKALTFIQDKSRFLGLKTVLLMESGKPDEAAKLIDEIIKNDPKNSQALIQYSYALLKQHRFDEAYKYLRIAAQISPDSKDLAALITQASVIYNMRKQGIEILVTMAPYSQEATQFITYLQDPDFNLDNQELE